MYKPQGIIHITGEHDSGKTTATLAYPLDKTAYIFDDVKKPPIDPGQFGFYLDLTHEFGDLKLIEFYHAVTEKLESMPEMDSIIFDTWTRYGMSIRYYAKANPTKFREAETFSKQGTIKGMEQWKESHRVEASIISALSRECKALFLITHIKDKLIAGKKTGSHIPDCGKSFDNICNLRLWLRHNPASGVPIALVLKRLVKIEITENGVRPINVLPRKLTPNPTEHYTIWDTIGHYWDNPIMNRDSKEWEKPTPYELSILDGMLTEGQKLFWQAEVQAEKEREREEIEFFNAEQDELQEKVNNLKDSFGDLPLPILSNKILEAIKEEYLDYTQEKVMSLLK